MSTSGAGQPPGPVPTTRTTSGTGTAAGGATVSGGAVASAGATAEGPRPPAQRTGTVTAAGAGIEGSLPAPRPYDFAVLRLPELRELRRDSQRDEADLSYLRRLLQGRIDILRAELARRTAPETPVVDRLSEILADTPSLHRTSARHVTLSTPRREEYRRTGRRDARRGGAVGPQAPVRTRSCTRRWPGWSVTSSSSRAAATSCSGRPTSARRRSRAGTVKAKHK